MTEELVCVQFQVGISYDIDILIHYFLGGSYIHTHANAYTHTHITYIHNYIHIYIRTLHTCTLSLHT